VQLQRLVTEPREQPPPRFVPSSYEQLDSTVGEPAAAAEDEGLITPTADTRYWIDALCINQADVAEKNVQVPLMGRIYQGAVRVVAFLGQDGDCTEAFSHSTRTSRMPFGIAST